MKNNTIEILNLLFAGRPVKLKDQVYYLGENNMLGVKMDRTIDGVKQEDDGRIYGVDWELHDFITVCEYLTPEEIEKIYQVAKENKDVLVGVESNTSLFDESKKLCHEMGLVLAGIVQNDIHIRESDFEEWVKDVQNKIKEIEKHAGKIFNYVKNRVT